MIDFKDVLDKLKKISGYSSDKDVARKCLNLAPDALVQRKNRNSIPHQKLIEYCLENGLSLDEMYNNDPMKIYVKNKTSNEAHTTTATTVSFGNFTAINTYDSNEKIILPFKVAEEVQSYYDDTLGVLFIFISSEFDGDGIYIFKYNNKIFVKNVTSTFNDTIKLSPVKDLTPGEVQEIATEDIKNFEFIGKINQIISIKDAKNYLQD